MSQKSSRLKTHAKICLNDFFRWLKNVADLLLIHSDKFKREAPVTFIKHSLKKSFKTIAITSLSINMKTKIKKLVYFWQNKY